MTNMAMVNVTPQTKPKSAFLPSQRGLHHKYSFDKKLANQWSSLSVSPPFIQPKLSIGAVDDEYEREADRVADTIMRMPDPVIRRKPT